MKKIGRYTIRGLLGRGGMAKVFRVTLPVIEKTFALKLLAPDPLLARLLGMDRLRALFTAEARTMAALNHPHIVAVHDFDYDQDQPFFVMAYFANNLGAMMGETYRVEKPSRIIAPDKALDYTRQTLSGLACLHHAGIVHRDIKPFNLLVTDRDTVQICDFGLSKLRGETFQGPGNLNVGSPYYAAPEQEADPDAATAAADLYAVGISLYRMVTGCLPVAPPREPAYRPPSRHNADLDSTWDRFIARAIDHRPDRRHSDAQAMLADLEALIEHWRQRKKATCALAPAPTPQTEIQPPETPRAVPIKAAPREARAAFKVDTLWRPTRYTGNRFDRPHEALLTDRATRLTWQQSGCPYPLDWHAAHAYIDRLNRECFGGRRHWRLPTICELITLLRPSPQMHDLCVAPLFDPTQRWLWSTDRRSFTAAYYVDTVLGFVGWNDFGAPYYVRAVCSPRSPAQ